MSHILPARAVGGEGFSVVDVRLYAKAIQFIYKQEAVPWFRPENKPITSTAESDAQMFRVVHGVEGRTISNGAFDTQAEAGKMLPDKKSEFRILESNPQKGVIYFRVVRVANNASDDGGKFTFRAKADAFLESTRGEYRIQGGELSRGDAIRFATPLNYAALQALVWVDAV